MALTQRGLVYSVGATETRQYQDKTFVSRSLVIEQPVFDQYTGEKRNSNYVKFEATRPETCETLNNYPVGSKVEVEFIVRGSKYSKKDGSGEDVFTRLELRNISFAGPAKPAAPSGVSPLPSAALAPVPAASAAQTSPTASDYDSELGF